MTTAHRPTFDPARGKEISTGPAYHQRLLPAHTKLKFRQPGQGGDADKKRDLRAELLKAEAAHYAKVKGTPLPTDEAEQTATTAAGTKRIADSRDADSDDEGEEGGEADEDNPEAKRRKILEATRDIDADSDGSGSDSDDSDSSDDDDDEEDETADLLRELEKIKKERAEAKEREEREKAEAEQEKREYDIARGNPLLNTTDFTVKRRWDDDVIFKNQARGTDDKGKKPEFVNDVLRSSFHKKFMSKYVR